MTTSTDDLVLRTILGEKYGKKEAKEESPKTPEQEFLEIEMDSLPTAGTKKYSEVFGWDKDVLKDKPDFPVTVYDREDWDELGKAAIPEVDPHREVDHSYMYPFVMGLEKQVIPMLVGHTGTGKTTATRYYAAKTNHPLYILNGRGDLESDDIIGRPWLPGGKKGMDFYIGEWPKATMKGWLTLWDEPWKTPAPIVMAAQRHMEGGYEWQIEGIPGELDDKLLKPDPRYRLILADNVVGTGDNSDQYAATTIQDSSSLNRVGMVLRVPYLTKEKEVALICRKFPFIPEKRANQMVNMLAFIRKGFESRELSSPASMRNIEKWAEFAYAIKSYEEAFKWILLERFAEDSERAAVVEQYFAVFGKRLF